MTSYDQPISLPADDLFGRAGFARSIAERLFNMTDIEAGFVLGIDGEWGSGKTSVVRMIISSLLHQQMAMDSTQRRFVGDTGESISPQELDRLAVLYQKISRRLDPDAYDFNYMSPDHFNRNIVCGDVTDENDKCSLYRYFRLRNVADRCPRNLVINFSPWLLPSKASIAASFVHDLTAAASKILGGDVEDALRAYANRISKLASVAGGIADAGSSFAGSTLKALSDVLKDKADDHSSLDELKRALERKLRTISPAKIIVVIDDLDRLTPAETAQMISIVKGLGELPNVAYILSYDANIIADHLDVEHCREGRGASYLEKIVQYQRRLPMLPENGLAQLLNKVLGTALQNIPQATVDRFQEIWRHYGQKTLRTPRDVNRLAISFAPAIDHVGKFVDHPDLFLLEIIRAKDHPLLVWIETNLEDLSGRNAFFTEEQHISEIKRMVTAKGWDDNSLQVRALAMLFPPVARAFDTFFGASGDKAQARRQKRLHVSEFGRVYFQLEAPEDVWERDFFEEALLATDPEPYVRRVVGGDGKAANVASKLRIQFLEDVVGAFGDGKAMSRAWFNALIKHSPRLTQLKDETDDFLGRRNNYRRLVNAMFRGLDGTPVEARGSLLMDLLREQADISIVCDLIRTAIGDLGQTAPRERMDLGGVEPALRELGSKRARELAKTGAIWSQADPGDIIWFWRGCGAEAEVAEFLADQAAKPETFSNVVDQLVSKVYSTEGDYEQVPEWMGNLMSIDVVTAAAKKYANAPGDQNYAQAVRYLNALERRED